MSPAKKRELKKGDMIEFLRGQFNHWAVFIGDGEVVHVTNDYISVSHKAVVKRETRESVAGDDKWRINNNRDSQFEPRPENDIVEDALARVGKEVPYPYHVLRNNCEHFVTMLRYGEPHSEQVEDFKEYFLGKVVGAVMASCSKK